MHLGIKNIIGWAAKYLFGDGSYSGNIIQGGAALQPQDYLLDGITPLTNCIVVTSTATVAPDAATGACVATGRNLVVVGAGATLAPSTNAKGLILLFNTGIHARSGGRIHIDKLGKAGNFGNLTVLDLVPASIKSKLKSSLATYVVLGEGAAGAPMSQTATGYLAYSGVNGTAASAMQTGGGGSGHVYSGGLGPTAGGAGGKGGPCCGGAGGGPGYGIGNGGDASSYGGPGGEGGLGGGYGGHTCGGPGNPAGANHIDAGTITYQALAGGGLLMLFTPTLSNASGCVISADGSAGSNVTSDNMSSPGAGGGCVVIGTQSGGYTNSGTVRAAGGAAGVGYNFSGIVPGAGGAGSVNTFTIN